MTLDKVPREFYSEIVKNPDQLRSWKELFAFGNESQATLTSGKALNENVLEAYPFLVLDTKYFSQNFKDRLLATFNNLDDDIGGIIVKSENWQALNLLENKYKNLIKLIYIDPPYNTGNDEFIYRDNYRHSSWIAMMQDRLVKSKVFLQDDGLLFVSIGEEEQHNLKIIISEIFGWENYIASIIWEKSKKVILN